MLKFHLGSIEEVLGPRRFKFCYFSIFLFSPVIRSLTTIITIVSLFSIIMKSCLPRSELDAVGVGHGIHRFDYLLWDQFLSSLLHISTVDSGQCIVDSILVYSLRQVANLQSPEYKYPLSSKVRHSNSHPSPHRPHWSSPTTPCRELPASYKKSTHRQNPIVQGQQRAPDTI